MTTTSHMKSDRLSAGVPGLDDILGGGYPVGRTTLLAGQPGVGKTLFSLAFLVNGCEQGETTVLMSFDETAEDMDRNVVSLGWDLQTLRENQSLLFLNANPVGEYHVLGDNLDITPLLIRLQRAVECSGARRVVLDALDNLFSRMQSSEETLRREVQRLVRWTKEQQITTLFTVEAGAQNISRNGIIEYLCDAVILLSLDVEGATGGRNLRISKLRGGHHSTSSHPFLITANGPVLAPLSTLELDHTVSNEDIGSGIPALDEVMGGGLYRGNTVLLSGPAGTGKSIFGSTFLREACRRGERALYLSFEESPRQIIRNMQSVGMDLEYYQQQGLLRITSTRPSRFNPEGHLAWIAQMFMEFQPSVVYIDPISCFGMLGEENQITAMLIRLVDLLKSHQATLLMSYLVRHDLDESSTALHVSSIADVWLVMRMLEIGGERNRGLFVIKSRGRSHSNQIREYLITDEGLHFPPVYVGPQGVLTGTARQALEAQEQAEKIAREEDIKSLEEKLTALKRRQGRSMRQLSEEFEDEESLLLAEIHQLQKENNTMEQDRQRMFDVRTGVGRGKGERS